MRRRVPEPGDLLPMRCHLDAPRLEPQVPQKVLVPLLARVRCECLDSPDHEDDAGFCRFALTHYPVQHAERIPLFRMETIPAWYQVILEIHYVRTSEQHVAPPGELVSFLASQQSHSDRPPAISFRKGSIRPEQTCVSDEAVLTGHESEQVYERTNLAQQDTRLHRTRGTNPRHRSLSNAQTKQALGMPVERVLNAEPEAILQVHFKMAIIAPGFDFNAGTKGDACRVWKARVGT